MEIHFIDKCPVYDGMSFWGIPEKEIIRKLKIKKIELKRKRRTELIRERLRIQKEQIYLSTLE